MDNIRRSKEDQKSKLGFFEVYGKVHIGNKYAEPLMLCTSKVAFPSC
jgi:hypothetical protein